jgi:ATP-dependent DNA helicase RecQ
VRLPQARQAILTAADIDLASQEVQRQAALRRHKALVRYAETLETCRMVQLQTYFGEADATACGICDVCKGRHRKEPTANVQQALRQELIDLAAAQPRNFRALAEAATHGTADQRLRLLNQLLEQGVLVLSTDLLVRRG